MNATYVDCECNNHPQADISHFRITQEDSKQVVREAREAIYIRINNPAFNHIAIKMCIQKIFSRLLGVKRFSIGLMQAGDTDQSQDHMYQMKPNIRYSRTVVWGN